MKHKQEYFAITRLHRDDINGQGYDASKLTDEQMEQFANKMANGYLNETYWTDLKIIAEEVFGLEKKETIKCWDCRNGKHISGKCQIHDKE